MMKRIGSGGSLTNFLSSSTSSRNTANNTKKNSSSMIRNKDATSNIIIKTFRQLSLDLSNEESVPALQALLKLPKQREKVRSAHIFTKNGYIRLSNANESQAVQSQAVSLPVMISQVFDLLSRLPNLRSVTVDMHHNVPLQALCLLLQCPKLKSLSLAHVNLTDIIPAPANIGNGSMTDLDLEDTADEEENEMNVLASSTFTRKDDLVSEILMNSSTSLQELTLIRCRSVGGAIVRLLYGVSTAGTLQKLTLSSTPIGSTYPAAEATLRTIVHNESLKTLNLRDVPGLLEENLTVFAEASPSLKELEITSSVYGDVAGEIIVSKLLRHNLLGRVEILKLHIDWEQSGMAVAKMLRTNLRLKQLDLRLYGDDDKVRQEAIVIAKSLRKPRHVGLVTPSLQKLRLCVEIDAERHNEPILAQIERALETNESLQVVQVDDSVEFFPLPQTLENKLRLNRCGARAVLRSDHANGPELAKAIISQKDHLDTVFHLLSNQPSFLLHCSDKTALTTITSNPLITTLTLKKSHTESLESVLSACSLGSVDSLTHKKSNYSFFASKQESNRSSAMRSSSKFLRKKVKNIFAVSA